MKLRLHRTTLASALSLAIVATLPLSAPALAQDTGQDQTAANPQKAVKLETITVTGSRIKSADVVTQVPVFTISSDDIHKTGLTSIGDILQQMTTSGSALNTKFNSAGNFGFPPDGSGVGSGSSTLDLRNLGAKRVLVLVDGMRWVNESSASGVSAAVDLNTIPAGIIDRIEILQDGASSLYGSDAIAGVVNIITKRSQKGGAASVYYGGYNNLSGGSTTSADLSFGNKGDRYEFFIDFSHVKQDAISSRAWNQSGGACVPGTGLANCSSATPTGRFIFTDPATGQTVSVTPNGAFAGKPNYPSDYHHFTTADRFNFAPYNMLLTPSTRNAIFGQVRYKLTDNITWYARGLYNNRKSTNQAAPEPIFLGPGAGTGGLADRVGVDVTNPYNPFGVTLNPDPSTGNLTLIGRRPIEGGPRVFKQDVDTRYFATGLEGKFDFADRDFFWDVNFADGDNKATQTVNGTYNIAHIQRALGPLANCTGNCVPLNLFSGPGSITPAMLNYIQYIEHDTSENKLKLYTVNLSGTAFNLPAGAFTFATGFEHRNYQGSYEPDAVVVAGESNGVPSLPTSGRYSINEYYLELNAPILKELPGVKALDLSAATRYSKYSTSGSTTNNKYGLRWQVYDDLTLRSTWAEGFRAPTIGELFGSPARFDATLQDPCSAPIASGQTKSNCAALGIPASYTQPNPQISVRTGGNRQLKPETARSLTWGAVYSPGWAENTAWSSKLDFTFGYYRITIKEAIQALDAQTKLDRCVASASLTSVFCQGIHRNATGNIDGFDATLQNLGTVNTSGFDFGANWHGPDTSYGRFNVNWQNTYVQKYEAKNGVGAREPRTVGLELNNSAIPRLHSTFGVGWAMQAWTVDYKLRYVSGLREDCAAAVGFPVCSSPNEIAPNRPNGTHHIGSVTYSDVRASWKLPIQWDLTLIGGINNLFDREPPICVSCSLNGYDAATYDIPSRFAYIQADLKF
ncbi:TonB-dependent receptor plug domain-containing protein [Dyella subtropica]|uniref:TonB-dependent receptor plug domain-containing protein n=1 Tax=Dyella subtropica TaxID=2992127 RepID=UPI00225715EC|nr:TonB-dependent receptor [Dyella subtropica]